MRMRKRSLVGAMMLTLLASLGSYAIQSSEANAVNDDRKMKLLQTAGDPKAILSERISSIRELGSSRDPSLIGSLKNLLARSKPGAEQKTMNWDPQAAERVVDMHLVAALHTLGDDSELFRIPILVQQAGDALPGPDDELRNAASVVLSVGQLNLVSAIIDLASPKDPYVCANAVKTLDQLNLPDAPVGGTVASVPHMLDKVSFTIRSLKEELQALEQQSQGSITLSPGVRTFLNHHDYERGTVRRDGVTLSDIVKRDVPLLDFDYFVETGHVVICTYSEAGIRWHNWWDRYGRDLEYQPDKSMFVLNRRG